MRAVQVVREGGVAVGVGLTVNQAQRAGRVGKVHDE